MARDMKVRWTWTFAVLVLFACDSSPSYDVLIRGGTVYDGSGGAPARVDIGIVGDTIAAVGDRAGARASVTIDAEGPAGATGVSHSGGWAEPRRRSRLIRISRVMGPPLRSADHAAGSYGP